MLGCVSYLSPFFMRTWITVYLLVPQWTLRYPPLALATRAPVNMGLPASEPVLFGVYIQEWNYWVM